MRFSILTLAALVSQVLAAPTALPKELQPPACSANRTKFKYFGVNQSCAEFGEKNLPGVLGKDYTWPTTQSIDYFLNQGFNTFRVAFKMERMTPNGLTSNQWDQKYLGDFKKTVDYITSKGGYAIGDPHNYARWKDQVISDTTGFGNWCRQFANNFKDNKNFVFDVNNEPHDMSQQLVVDLNQACINGIRAAGATSQLILVEGNSWTGAWTWVSSGNAASMINLKDPNNNIAFEMHQYLDSDGSGTSPNCVSSSIGRERLAAATKWLKDNNVKGFLGEIGAGSNNQCIDAVHGALCSMQESGVWLGALWWAAGPWWADYFQSIEPPNGAAIPRILPEALKPFL